MEERLSVVEEIDAGERGPRLVDHFRKQVEIEHSGFARPGDSRLGCATGIEAGQIARGGAFDEKPARQWSQVERPNRRRGVVEQRDLQRALAAEVGASCVEIASQIVDRRVVPDLGQAVSANITEALLRVRVGTSQTTRPSHSRTSVVHGHAQVKRVARWFSDTGGYVSVSFRT